MTPKRVLLRRRSSLLPPPPPCSAGCGLLGRPGPGRSTTPSTRSCSTRSSRSSRRRPASRSSCATARTSSWPTSSSQEGDASPADVFLTENSPAMTLVDNAGLFAAGRRGHAGADPGRSTSRRPATGSASPPARRSLVYNTDSRCRGRAARLDPGLRRAGVEGPGRASPRPAPTSRRSSAPSSQLEGEEATADWLAGPGRQRHGLRATTRRHEAVNAGEVDAGIIYHYYWYRDQAESGENSDNVAAALLRQPGPGRLRQHLRRRRARRRATPGGRPAVRRVPHQRPRASRRSPTPTRWSTRSTPRSPSTPRSSRSTSSSRPQVDLADAQRPEGHRADAGGRAALTPRSHAAADATAAGPADGPTAPAPAAARRPGSRSRCSRWSRSASSSSTPSLIGPAEAWELLVRPRVGELLLEHRPAGSSAAMLTQLVLGVGARLAGRAHRPARAGGSGTPARRAARGPGVRQQLRLGLAHRTASRATPARC